MANNRRERSRGWCFTINNPVDSDRDEIYALRSKGARYVIYGHEHRDIIGATPHFQGYVLFDLQKDFAVMKRLLPRAHLEKAKGLPEHNIAYCSKGDQPCEEYHTLGTAGPNYGKHPLVREMGERPMTTKRKGEIGAEAERERWAKIRKLACEGNLEEIGDEEPEIFVAHYRTLKQIAVDHMQRPKDLEQPRAIWCCGETGRGKSTKYRTMFADAYIKNQTKWWDGYQGEDVVILEDISEFHVKLGDYMKLWSDKWSFKAETKGSCLWIRPKLFVVTSQYRIEDIWRDAETRDALKRRFKVEYMSPFGLTPAVQIPVGDPIFHGVYKRLSDADDSNVLF